MNSIRSNLHFFPSLSRLLEKYSTKDVYGDESDEYKVGIDEQEELIAEGKGKKKINIIFKSRSNDGESCMIESRWTRACMRMKVCLTFHVRIPNSKDSPNPLLLSLSMRGLAVTS